MKDFVKQPEFKQAIVSLEERKADRSELRKLHDLMELQNNKPTSQVQVVKETVVAAAEKPQGSPGNRLTDGLIERWDGYAARIDALQRLIDDLLTRLTQQENRKMQVIADDKSV